MLELKKVLWERI